MRGSVAVLKDTGVRLWELRFPRSRVLMHRTRVPYVNLDGLIAFSKRDRDGKVDAFLCAWLPDEVALIFFLGGEVVNAAMLTPIGRFTVPIAQALQHIQGEAERSEVAFYRAPREQLAAMYAACTQPPVEQSLDASSPEGVFRALMVQRWTGLLELISNGRVNYVQVQDGRYVGGFLCDQRSDDPPNAHIARLFASVPPEPLPKVSASSFLGLAAMPVQAPPAMVAMLRNVVWGLTDLLEQEHPGEGGRRAERARQRLVASRPVLQHFGGPRGVEGSDPLAEPAALADAIAAWTADLLGELEVISPGCAPRLVRDSMREHRFALNAVGFFERLPWRIQW